MRVKGRSGLVIGVVVALLVVFVDPAAASSGPYLIEVEAGTLSTVLGGIELPLPNDGPCEPKASTLSASTDGVAPAGTWTADGTFSSQFEIPFNPGEWYRADFEVLAGTGGSWDGIGPTYSLDGVVIVQVVIKDIGREVGDPNFPDCEKDGTCTIMGLFTIDDGAYNSVGPDSLPDANVGDTAVIDASTASSFVPLAAANCSGNDFGALNNTNASIDDLTLEVI